MIEDQKNQVKEESYELCEMFAETSFEQKHTLEGIKFLEIPGRIKRCDVPPSLYAYGIRECDSGGGTACLKNYVVVNHYSDVVTNVDLELVNNEVIELKRYGMRYLGQTMTFKELMNLK